MTLFRALLAGVIVIWLGVSVAAKDVLLVFTASWCGPCQEFKRAVKEDPGLTEGYALEVFDVDVAKEMAQDFGVKTVPTFVVVEEDENGVIKKETERARQVGYEGTRKLRRWLDKQAR